MEEFCKVYRDIYIDELNQFRKLISDELYTNLANKVNCIIAKSEQDFYEICKSFDEAEIAVQRQNLEYIMGINQLMLYRFLSAFYQVIYSIWELQVAYYSGMKIEQHYNERITEFGLLVNVLKHGKYPPRGRAEGSYDKLKEKKSNYLQKSEKFKNIIPEIYGGEILNLSIDDLLELCDEIICIWSNM